MTRQIFFYLRYELERFLLRGAMSRLLLVSVMILWIAALGGVLAFAFTDQFDSLAAAIWWAFLRLTDPGYLGDDEGLFLRTVSTAVTVLGYVIFLGALVAIMTQWFHQTMKLLSSGTTPLVRKNHILVIGATNRTSTILRELFQSSGRVRRFLRLRGVRQLHVVLLSEREPEEVLEELRTELGDAFHRSAISVRHGSPLRVEHLRRVDFLRASAILIPADDERGTGFRTRDEDATKILWALGQAMREEAPPRPPVVVAEVSSDEKARLARRAYGGDSEIIPTEQMMAWILALEVDCPGVLAVFEELLAQADGDRVYVNGAEPVVGRTIGDLCTLLPQAVVFGVLRGVEGVEPILNPSPDFVLEQGDRLLSIASDLKHTSHFDLEAAPARGPEFDPQDYRGSEGVRRVLILGWSRKVPVLIDALGGDPIHAQAIDVFSRVPVTERETLVERDCAAHRTKSVRHLEGDVTSRHDLSRLDFNSYDHVLLVASDRLESDAESDARTMLTCLAVDDLLGSGPRPHMTAEMLQSENADLFRARGISVMQTAVIPSMLLTQITLHRELSAAFDDIIRPGGAELRIVSAEEIGLTLGESSFARVRLEGLSRGVTVLGIRGQSPPGTSDLAPDAHRVFHLKADTLLVVLLTVTRRSTEI